MLVFYRAFVELYNSRIGLGTVDAPGMNLACEQAFDRAGN